MRSFASLRVAVRRGGKEVTTIIINKLIIIDKLSLMTKSCFQ